MARGWRWGCQAYDLAVLIAGREKWLLMLCKVSGTYLKGGVHSVVYIQLEVNLMN